MNSMEKPVFSDVVMAFEEGRSRFKRHRDLWLWNEISSVVMDADDMLRAVHGIDDLNLWLPDTGDSLKFVVGGRSCKQAGVEIVIAHVHVPIPDDDDDSDDKLVDHGVLQSLDGRLVIEFDDAATFRTALCALLKTGSVGRIFEKVYQIGLRLKGQPDNQPNKDHSLSE
jgi:hypothetical protein